MCAGWICRSESKLRGGTSRFKAKRLPPSITPRAATSRVCLCVCLGVLVCTAHFHNCICCGKRSTYSHFRLWFINPSDSSQCTHSFISAMTFFPSKNGCHLFFSFLVGGVFVFCFCFLKTASLKVSAPCHENCDRSAYGDIDGMSFENNYFFKKTAPSVSHLRDCYYGESE